MPPTTVISYRNRHHYDDISISTSSIQKCRPTSLCDDIATTFYMNCIQPLADLIPHIEDEERMLAEAAFERGRCAVIDGNDLNVVVWEKHLRRKRLERRLAEKRLTTQMEREQAVSRQAEANGAAADQASTCSSSSGSFVVKPRKAKKLTFTIPRRLSKVNARSDNATCRTNGSEPNLVNPSSKPSLALTKVMVLTARQRLAPTVKRVMKSPYKLSVNKKGSNVKPKLFRRKKKSSGESVSDDITLSSSNPPSESSAVRGLVVTEVSAREFGDSIEKQYNDDGSLSSDEATKYSTNCKQTSKADESVVDDSLTTVPVPCIMIDKQQVHDPKPIVAAARRTLGPTTPKKNLSARFRIDESPGRTVYDEREVDNFVSKLMPTKAARPDDAIAADTNDEIESKDDKSVAESAVRSIESLNMNALMHLISEKYSRSREIGQNVTIQADNESVLTDEKISEQSNESSSHENSIPSIISVNKRVNVPPRQSPITPSVENPTSTDAIAFPPKCNDSFDTQEPITVGRDDIKASKLNRLRMVRSLYAPSNFDVATNQVTELSRSSMPSQREEEKSTNAVGRSRHQRVSWAAELTRTSSFGVENQCKKEDRDLYTAQQCSHVPTQDYHMHGTRKLDRSRISRSVSVATEKPNPPSDNMHLFAADSGKLNRLRLARFARLSDKSFVEEEKQPLLESPLCTRSKHYKESKLDVGIESRLSNDMRVHIVEKAANNYQQDLLRREMNKRARQIHLQRTQRFYTMPAPPSLVVSDDTQCAHQSGSTYKGADVQKMPRNLMFEEARRVRSFQSKMVAYR